jgi:VIT1/CCC1 family predicted Fe2+/Mn2+ transporter
MNTLIFITGAITLCFGAMFVLFIMLLLIGWYADESIKRDALRAMKEHG